MHRITIRNFQRSFFTEIKDLPLEVVKNGIPFLRVEKLPTYDEEVKRKNMERLGRLPAPRCQFKKGWKFCHKYSVGEFPFKFNDNEGNFQTINLFLCDEHSQEHEQGMV